MSRVVFLCVLELLAITARTARAQEFDHSPWGRVLQKYVTDTGRVDYAALKASPADLNRFVDQIASRSPVSHPQVFPTRESQLAYWINAYNALVMKAVVENWPTKSVRNLGKLYSFFWARKFIAGGKEYIVRREGVPGIGATVAKLSPFWPQR